MEEIKDNIIEFTGGTVLDIPPEKILKAAIDASLESVTVIGIKEDGSTYVAFSSSDLALSLWMLENAKLDILHLGRGD